MCTFISGNKKLRDAVSLAHAFHSYWDEYSRPNMNEKKMYLNNFGLLSFLKLERELFVTKRYCAFLA